MAIVEAPAKKANEKPAQTKIAPPTKKQKGPIQDKNVPHTAKPSLAGLKPLQFKIPANIHQEVKLYAVERGMTMTDLFLKMFQEYRENHS